MDANQLADFIADIQQKTPQELIHIAVVLGSSTHKSHKMNAHLLSAYKTFGDYIGRYNRAISEKIGVEGVPTGFDTLDGTECTDMRLSAEEKSQYVSKYNDLVMHESTDGADFIVFTHALHAIIDEKHDTSTCTGCARRHTQAEAIGYINKMHTLRPHI